MTKIFNQPNYKKVRQKLRNEAPKAEQILWKKLRRKQINDLKFHRQYGINKFIVDFYCPKLKLVIEIDGDTHYSEDYQIKDQLRDKELFNLGLMVLRFNNNDIYYNLDGVMERIYEVVQNPSQPPL